MKRNIILPIAGSVLIATLTLNSTALASSHGSNDYGQAQKMEHKQLDKKHGMKAVNYLAKKGLLKQTSDYLGVSKLALIKDFRSGKSLANILAANNKTSEGLINHIVSMHKKHLDKKVADGKMTQAVADAKLNLLKTQVTEQVNSVLNKTI